MTDTGVTESGGATPGVTALRLADLGACFEGVIPSLVATADAQGWPNLSYLSHVVMVDEAHVGLSNQFFGKTAANLRDNPRATLLLVDGHSGRQFRLDTRFRRTVTEGPLFDKVASQLRASSAQAGMEGIMRLRGVDIHRVEAIDPVPHALPAQSLPRSLPLAGDGSGQAEAPIPRQPATLDEAARVAAAIADAQELDRLLDALLDGLSARFPRSGLLVLAHDDLRGVLVTVASRGFGRAGIGSEVPLGHGTIGVAAAERVPVRIADMSRARRFAEAVRASGAEEHRTRTIALPGLPGTLSQVAVPLLAQGRLHGVLYAESAERLAFDAADEALFALLARQAASALAALEAQAGESVAAPQAPPPPGFPGPAAPAGPEFRVVFHGYDGSLFIDNDYVIKGVPGRLLASMLESFVREGRTEFSNRELRLLDSLGLPPVKDNLETRLLLLRRRLEEKALPVSLLRTGRGRLRLELRGRPVIEQA